jgi:hypothetical protein
MPKLLGAVLAILLPLPAAAAGDGPSHPLALIFLYLPFGYLALAFGYGFSAMRALPAAVGPLILALIPMVGVWSAYGVQKALTALFVAGTLVLLFAPILGLGVYLGRRAGRRATACKVLSTNGT